MIAEQIWLQSKYDDGANMMAEQVVTPFFTGTPKHTKLASKTTLTPPVCGVSVRDIDNKDHLQWRLLILEENHDQQYRQSKKTTNLTKKKNLTTLDKIKSNQIKNNKLWRYQMETPWAGTECTCLQTMTNTVRESFAKINQTAGNWDQLNSKKFLLPSEEEHTPR